MRNRAIWIVCLSIYLILQGLILLTGLAFTGITIILGILALIAGICLFLGK